MEILQQVAELVKKTSWFDCESSEPHSCSFSTRQHGNTGDEEPGQADIQEARRLGKLIVEHFPALNVRMSVCDEWVNLEVDDYPKYYSVATIQKRLQEMGYATGRACGGTTEAVMIVYKGRQIAVVSARGMPLTLGVDSDSVYTPLQCRKKVVVGLIENIKQVLEEQV